jgi:hypothetical protein
VREISTSEENSTERAEGKGTQDTRRVIRSTEPQTKQFVSRNFRLCGEGAIRRRKEAVVA